MSSLMSRRRWLRLAGGTLASLGAAGRLYAAPPGGPRFLLVFLRGGYDATNTLIPYSSDFYYEARPGIAIPRPEDRKSTRLNSSHGYISYAVFCLKKKKRMN